MGDDNLAPPNFSPSGKLLQVEAALNAVKNGQPSVALKGTNFVVLATESLESSVLSEPQAKMEKISKRTGCVYSGLDPDARQLVNRARKIAIDYEETNGEEISTTQLVTRLAAVIQAHTQAPSGGVRPFGASLLIAGWDVEQGKPLLYQCDPTGAYFACKATALGKNDVKAKTFLEKRFAETMSLDDGVLTALLTLKGSVGIEMTEENVEVAVCDAAGFRALTKMQVKGYLGGAL